MANHKSAKKRHRQSLKKYARNTGAKSEIKTAVKKVRTSTSEGNTEQAAIYLKQAISLLDRAVTKGVLHRNNASRKISRLTVSVASK